MLLCPVPTHLSSPDYAEIRHPPGRCISENREREKEGAFNPENVVMISFSFFETRHPVSPSCFFRDGTSPRRTRSSNPGRRRSSACAGPARPRPSSPSTSTHPPRTPRASSCSCCAKEAKRMIVDSRKRRNSQQFVLLCSLFLRVVVWLRPRPVRLFL